MKSHRRRQNLIAARKENARLGKEIAQSLPDVVEIISTETVLDLLWQDGTRSEKVPAKSFVPVRHLDTYDFFPGHFVTRVADPTQTSNLSMNGVVECMNQAVSTHSLQQSPRVSQSLLESVKPINLVVISMIRVSTL